MRHCLSEGLYGGADISPGDNTGLVEWNDSTEGQGTVQGVAIVSALHPFRANGFESLYYLD
jgi:hypothetical protein